MITTPGRYDVHAIVDNKNSFFDIRQIENKYYHRKSKNKMIPKMCKEEL